MTNKRISLLLSLLVLLGLVLSACGGAPAATQAPAEPATEEVVTEEAAPAEAAATEAPAEEAATEAAAEAPSGDEVVLRWRTRPDNQEEANVYAEISDELDQKLEGVSLEYEPGGSESSSYQDQLKVEIANGTAPDVFWIPGTDVADFATRGLILNMADLAGATEGFDEGAFYPGPMYHLTFNPETSASGADSGALWGLPRDVSTFVLYLNKDLLAEAGAPDPIELAANGEWNWDSFVEVASAVRGLGSDIYGYGANAWWGPYGTWMNCSRWRLLQRGPHCM